MSRLGGFAAPGCLLLLSMLLIGSSVSSVNAQPPYAHRKNKITDPNYYHKVKSEYDGYGSYGRPHYKEYNEYDSYSKDYKKHKHTDPYSYEPKLSLEDFAFDVQHCTVNFPVANANADVAVW